MESVANAIDDHQSDSAGGAIASMRCPGRGSARRTPAAAAARRTRSTRARHLVPVAAAAAFLVLVGGGVTIGSATAEPDSALWPVSKVLFSERAESVEAATKA